MAANGADRDSMAGSRDQALDPGRYRKVRRFFAGVLLHALWWEVILNRPWLRLFRRPAIPRWQAIARKYRALAVEMGGVLIKLGQFLSIRVDLLPDAVIAELTGLQDEVPPAPVEAVIARIEADFQKPISRIFPWIADQPLGAASLAQAHAVQLPDGRPAVAKVLRPGIEKLVETDLAAISVALGWLKHYRRLSDRVDLDWLAQEFIAVTRNELDFRVELENLRRLAQDMAEDPEVCFPAVFPEYSSQRTLCLENVGYIRIADIAAMDRCGIDRSKVADRLYRLYMKQVFERFFVHVDPHPGNLFVRPLPTPAEKEKGKHGFLPGEIPPYSPGRPFQLVFVDFGMAVAIPERLRAALREYAIGVGTRDAHRIVQALVNSGSLRPGADLRRMEAIHQAMFERLWGTRTGQFRQMALKEAQYFATQYRDLIYEAPFQFQADMLFVVRAVGMLSGMAAHLDPEFDVWAKTIPFAERYAREELKKGAGGWLREALHMAALIFRMPDSLDKALGTLIQGRLTVQTRMADDLRQAMGRLEQRIRQLSWTVAGVGGLLAGTLFETVGREPFIGNLLIGAGIVAFLWGMWRG